jgi:hypothetical protein
MKPHDLFERIESDNFFVEMTIAADIDVFIQFAKHKEVVKSLLEQLQDKSVQNEVSRRVFELLKRDFDPEYLRPADVAIAIYLLALDSVRSPETGFTALEVEQASNLWWAIQVASKVQKAHQQQIDTR